MPIIDDDANVNITGDADHIRDWIEDHNGKPAQRKETDSVDVELDIYFEDEDEGDNLEPISWKTSF